MTAANESCHSQKASWRDYLVLCKPRVVALMLLTALVGMLLAQPLSFSLTRITLSLFGIACAASAAAAINHLIDRRIDAVMQRTQKRPLVKGVISTQSALVFATILAILSVIILCQFANTLTAIVTLTALFGYAFIYTGFLKRATPQNIVIGGITGAAPPLLGWVAMTGQLDAQAWLLVLIIFVWTPPHFWALAIARREEYAKANIPMLPVTHGVPYTAFSIFLYTVLLVVASCLPYVFNLSGLIYLFGVLLINLRFVWYAWRVWKKPDKLIAMQCFKYSIYYLMLLFVLLLVDRYIALLGS